MRDYPITRVGTGHRIWVKGKEKKPPGGKGGSIRNLKTSRRGIQKLSSQSVSFCYYWPLTGMHLSTHQSLKRKHGFMLGGKKKSTVQKNLNL
jgi:hypothetical protein